MTGPDLTVALNQLVADGVIARWHRASTWQGVNWIVVPHAGPSVRYSRAGIVDFVDFAQAVTHVG